MAVKGKALFQIPDWIEKDRPRSKPNIRSNVRTNVIPVTKLNIRPATTIAEVTQAQHHRDSNSATTSKRAETIESGAFLRNTRVTGKTGNGKQARAFARRNCENRSSSTEKGRHQKKPCDEGERTPTRKSSPELNGHLPNDEDDHTDIDILFFNLPSSSGNHLEDDRPMGRISPANLMQGCGTSSPELVFEANLHSQGLEKIQNLDQFVKLRTLDLSCNAIPKIENLHQNKELRDLKLYDNRIPEITGLDSLQDLCHLQLQHNRISQIGAGLANQRRLQVLRVDSNRLERLAARELAPLSNLVSLDLSSNQLQDITSVNAVPSLEELNASHNKLETVADIGRCKQLTDLNISFNRLKDVSDLCGLHTLMVLSMSENLLTNNSLKTLGKLQSLQYLDVSGNRLTDLSMIPGQFPALEVLRAARNKLEDLDKLHCLQKCASLTELVLEGNPVCHDEESYHRLRQDLVAGCSSLEMMDGVHVKRSKGTLSHAPLMRPMSASTAVSTRQVENQLKLVEDTLSSFQVDLTSSFADLRSSMSFLPSESPSTHEGTLSRSSTPKSPAHSSSRAASRCGSRQRIAEAKAYASTHFDVN